MTDLIERLQRLLPVSWDNELDGHGEPTHAVLTFGEHETQAITMRPDDWMVLNELPEALQSQSGRIAVLVGALKDIRDFGPDERSAVPPHTQIAVFARTRARSALTKEGQASG